MKSPLEWATLAVCCVVLLLRLPDAVRGRNRAVFGILFLATLCSFLAVPELYAAVDGALGGRGATSLILRYTVFATVLLVGVRLTQGLAAAREHRLIAGAPGRWALGLSWLAVTAAFVLLYTDGPRSGLEGPLAAIGGERALAALYAAAGRTYPAYVSLLLVPPLLAAFRSRLPRLVRAGALTVLIGASFAVLSLPVSLAPAGWAGAQDIVNYGSVLGYVVGLALFWFSGLIDNKSGNTKATLREKGG